MATEQQVKMASKLYQCRDSAKKLFREEYKEKIQWYVDVIKAWQEKHKLDVLQAVLQICNTDSIKDDGMGTMMFMAGAVEIIEPSK